MPSRPRGRASEEYFVQKNGKWVPMDGPPRAISAKNSRSEYSIMENGKWVKMDGVSSPDDIIRQLRRKNRTNHDTSHRIRQVVVPQPQPAQQQAPAQPQEYREYFVTVKPFEPVALIEPPAPAPVQPNEYVEEPPPPRRRPRPPRPEVVVVDRPVPVPVAVPHPVVIEKRPPKPKIDYYALGQEAARRELVVSRPHVDCYEEEEVYGPPRTSPSDGYYLAGYIHYGNPGEAPPVLQPMPVGGVPSAGGGGGCGYPDHPSTVELVYEEYDDPGMGGGSGQYYEDGVPTDSYYHPSQQQVQTQAYQPQAQAYQPQVQAYQPQVQTQAYQPQVQTQAYQPQMQAYQPQGQTYPNYVQY